VPRDFLRLRRFGPGSRKSAVKRPSSVGAELCLLPLLSTHLSFPEIAEDLFLSPTL